MALPALALRMAARLAVASAARQGRRELRRRQDIEDLTEIGEDVAEGLVSSAVPDVGPRHDDLDDFL